MSIRPGPTLRSPDSARLLDVDGLRVEFHTPTGVVHAVDGFSYVLDPGRTLAIVGESGSGKSVSAMALLGLLPKTARIAGTASFRGTDLLKLTPGEAREIRGREIAMVFQDPLTALNPVHRVGKQITEMIHAHVQMPRAEARQRAIELLRTVEIPNPERRVDQFPHEFSGGMRQRAMIAMALALEPKILIADEPTTALDVTVQAQILELLKGLQDRFGMGLILITHDLGIVARVADEILVVYAGRMVERGNTADIFYEPQHPYTWGLLGSLPRLDGEQERLTSIPGLPPSLLHVPPGCPFHPRCTVAFDRCVKERPALERRVKHEDACFLDAAEREKHRKELLKR